MAQMTLQVTAPSGFPSDETGYEQGVSACFAGIIGDELIIAGGCNFPDGSGVKRYYEGIYAAHWRSDTLRWRRIGILPEPAAYGATVQAGDSLLLGGGCNSRHSLPTVTVIRLNAQRQAVLSSLPSLPVTFDNGTATYAKGKVLVFGGNQNGKPSKALWSYHLQQAREHWTKQRCMPGRPRVQPVGVTHGARFFVWGGYHADGDHSQVATDGYSYDVTRNRWSPLPAPTDMSGEPLTLSGATGTTDNRGLVMCLGGVNKDIFADAISGQYKLVNQSDYLKQPVTWYRFNALPLFFDTKKRQWLPCSTPDPRLARAGAQIVACEDCQYLYIGGELKPGVRTPQILRLTIR